MLIACPECGLQLSDKAIICPHCGFPVKPSEITYRRSKNKYKRLPNGFGQITEIKNRNLRKPFRAMVTVGFNELAKPICKLLKPEAYFKTYNDAYQALVEYHKSGSELACETTFEELYSEWSNYYYKDINNGTASGYKTAWNYLSPIYNVRVVDAKVKLLKDTVETATRITDKGETIVASPKTKRIIKILLNLLYDFAIENNITDKNFSRAFSLSKTTSRQIGTTEKEHIPFTDEERKTLWQNINDYYVKLIIVQCYTGFRPQEMIRLRTDSIDFTKWNIIGGMKTDSGTDRVVPIHSSIKQIIKKQYAKAKKIGSETLFFNERTNGPLTQYSYKDRYDLVISKYHLNPDHRPHDPRKDFVTMAKKAKMDEYAIKRIVGHKIKDITENVYTERDSDWLHEEIEKIKVGCN